MLSSHPRDQPITIRRSKDRATTSAAEEADAKTPVLPIIPEAPPVVIPTAPPVGTFPEVHVPARFDCILTRVIICSGRSTCAE